MKEKIKSFLLREKFKPSFFGIFVNPYYFSRKGLYRSVYQYKDHLSGKLLDFGCGNKPYKDILNVDEHIGLDIEESGHDGSQYDIDVFWDGKTIPFNDAHFDCVLTSEVLEHIFEPDLALQEIHRVCKTGGKLLLTVPFTWNEHEVPYDYGRYTSYGLNHILKKNGFEIIHHTKTTNFVETVFQLWNTYVFQCVLRVPVFQMIFTPILIAPVTIFGIIISRILPRNKTLFLNNVIVAVKS